MGKNKIILLGGGGHCKSVIDVIECGNEYEVAGIFDKQEFLGQEVSGYKIFAQDEQIPDLINQFSNFIITVGQIKSNTIRLKLYDLVKENGGILPSIASPKSYISKNAHLNEGCIVMHNCFVNSGAIIGINSILNTGSIIEHDAQIGNHCHISTGAIVNGNCVVEDNCFIGSNAVIAHGVRLKSGSIIGAGAVVLNDTESNTLNIGNPAIRRR